MSTLEELAGARVAEYDLDNNAVWLPIEIIQWVLVYLNAARLCSYLKRTNQTLNGVLFKMPNPQCQSRFVERIFDLASNPRLSEPEFRRAYYEYLQSALNRVDLGPSTWSRFAVTLLHYDYLGFFSHFRPHPLIVTRYSKSINPIKNLLSCYCNNRDEFVHTNLIYLYCSLKHFTTSVLNSCHKPSLFSTCKTKTLSKLRPNSCFILGSEYPVADLPSPNDLNCLADKHLTKFLIMCIEAYNYICLSRYHNAFVMASEAVVLKIECGSDKWMRNFVSILKRDMLKYLTFLTAHLTNNPTTAAFFLDRILSLRQPLDVSQLILCLQSVYSELDYFEAEQHLYVYFVLPNQQVLSSNYHKALVNHFQTRMDFAGKLLLFATSYQIHYRMLGENIFLFDKVKRFKSILKMLCATIQEGKELLHFLHLAVLQNGPFSFVNTAYKFMHIKLALYEHLLDELIGQRFSQKPNPYFVSKYWFNQPEFSHNCKFLYPRMTGECKLELHLFKNFVHLSYDEMMDHVLDVEILTEERVGLKYSKLAARTWMVQGLLCLHKTDFFQDIPSFSYHTNPFRKAMEHLDHIPNGKTTLLYQLATFTEKVMNYTGNERLPISNFVHLKQRFEKKTRFENIEQALAQQQSIQSPLSVASPFKDVEEILNADSYLGTAYLVGL